EDAYSLAIIQYFLRSGLRPPGARERGIRSANNPDGDIGSLPYLDYRRRQRGNMVANRYSATSVNSRVPYHARMQAAAAKFLANAIHDDLRRGRLDDLKTHIASAIECVEQQTGIDIRARAEIYLALG